MRGGARLGGVAFLVLAASGLHGARAEPPPTAVSAQVSLRPSDRTQDFDDQVSPKEVLRAVSAVDPRCYELRPKARAGLLVLAHRNELGGRFSLAAITYALDGAQIFSASAPTLNSNRFEIYRGLVVLGRHQVTVQYDIIDQTKGEKVTLLRTYPVDVEGRKVTTVLGQLLPDKQILGSSSEARIAFEAQVADPLPLGSQCRPPIHDIPLGPVP